jgi:uncharacterized membrane protein YfcA
LSSPLLEHLAVAGAGLLAGAVNALAGGGTIISFPVLIAVGLPAVNANITNTVALSPGYVAGTWSQRADLKGQEATLRRLVVVAAGGGAAGSVLLIEIPPASFKVAVPYLILLACALLLCQDPVRAALARRAARRAARQPAPDAGTGGEAGGAAEAPGEPVRPPLLGAELLAVFACSVYGGFFGAGLGIMLLAVLGLFSTTTLVRTNALKQALSAVINCIAAILFAFSRKVDWTDAGVLAIAAVAGASVGGRLVRRVNPQLLRGLVVLLGIAVAVRSFV